MQFYFKRNIVLKMGLLYLLIHHYISLCFFEENVALEIGYTLSFDTPLHFLVAFQKKSVDSSIYIYGWVSLKKKYQ